jgi:hypothetical protein
MAGISAYGGREQTPCSAHLMSARSEEGFWGGGRHQGWKHHSDLRRPAARRPAFFHHGGRFWRRIAAGRDGPCADKEVEPLTSQGAGRAATWYHRAVRARRARHHTRPPAGRKRLLQGGPRDVRIHRPAQITPANQSLNRYRGSELRQIMDVRAVGVLAPFSTVSTISVRIPSRVSEPAPGDGAHHPPPSCQVLLAILSIQSGYVRQAVDDAFADRFLKVQHAPRVPIGVRPAASVFPGTVAPIAQILERALERPTHPSQFVLDRLAVVRLQAVAGSAAACCTLRAL